MALSNRIAVGILSVLLAGVIVFDIAIWRMPKPIEKAPKNNISQANTVITPLPETDNLFLATGVDVFADPDFDVASKSLIPAKSIDISLSEQTMTLTENGSVVDVYTISSGKKGMETPKGTFRVENKAQRPFSKEYGLYMPYWLAILPSGKIGIHELPEWPGGYKEGANHLGIPVSHGCVRLGVGPAKRVWEWAPVGTPVIVR